VPLDASRRNQHHQNNRQARHLAARGHCDAEAVLHLLSAKFSMRKVQPCNYAMRHCRNLEGSNKF
jgi:hypothetical protein